MKKTVSWWLALAICLAVSPLGAQTPAQNKAAARNAAEAGVKAYGAREYEKAVDLLQRAEKLYHAPTHLLYLARSQAQLGRMVEARENYILLTREQLPDNASLTFQRAVDDAREELAELEPRVPVLTVEVKGDPEGNATVSLDGELIPPAMIGLPMPTNPGKRQLKAELSGYRPDSAVVTLEEGDEQTVTLELRATKAGEAKVAATSRSEPQEDGPGPRRRSKGRRVAGFSALGVGAVGIGLGTWAVLRRSSKTGEADSAFDACSPNCTPNERRSIESIDQDAKSAGNLAIIGFGAGALGVATGVALLAIKPKKKSADIRPWITGNSVGLSGRF